MQGIQGRGTEEGTLGREADGEMKRSVSERLCTGA